MAGRADADVVATTSHAAKELNLEATDCKATLPDNISTV
jgi:hypothetical protein